MNWYKKAEAVGSSWIDDIDYNSGTLTIRMANGGTYKYFDVPESTYRRLMEADRDPEQSVGRIFTSHIKSMGYEFEKVPS